MTAVSYDDVVTRLAGLDAWLDAAARGVAKFDRANIERRIPGWVRRFERETQFRINPVQVVTSPDGVYNTPTPEPGTVSSAGTKVTGLGTSFLSTFRADQIIVVGSDSLPVKSVESDTDLTLYDSPASVWAGAAYGQLARPVVIGSAYPYFREDAGQFMMTTLRDRPIRSVQRLRMMLNNHLVAQFPPEWFTWETNGRFWIVPLYASVALTRISGAWAVYGSISDFLPDFLHFDFIAGLPDGWQSAAEWSDVQDALESWCALQILSRISQTFGAGLSNKGVSSAVGNQNFSYTRFKDLKQELEANVSAFKEVLVAQQTPFLLDYI